MRRTAKHLVNAAMVRGTAPRRGPQFALRTA